MTQQKNWRIARVLLGAALLLALFSLSGCGLTRETQKVVNLARRTTFLEPRFYDYVRSDKLAQREARLRAEQAWAEIASSLPNASPDYENGFTEGFADYLYRGGEGEPPLIPPRGYWNLKFLNKFGEATTNDWYAGFRHGAQTCKASGLRELWTVPTSLLLGQQDETVKAPVPQQLSQPKNSRTNWQPNQPVDSKSPAHRSDDVTTDIDPAASTTTTERQPEPPVPSLPPGDAASQRDDELQTPAGRPPNDAAEADLEKVLDAGTEPGGPASDQETFESELFTPPVVDPNAFPGADGESTDETSTDDIFSLPDDAFESSDSFQPDVDEMDFNFHSKREPSSNDKVVKVRGPMAIKSVQPASDIPTPILLMSAEYDDDLPPPPTSLPLLPRANQPTRQQVRTKPRKPSPRPAEQIQQETARELPSELPTGRPRMASRRVGDVTQAPAFRIGEAETTAAPLQQSPLQDRPTLSSSSSSPPIDESLLLDLPPLQLTRANEPRPEIAAAQPPVDERAPVVMWLDDKLPPVVAATPMQEKVRIGSTEWEPLASDAQSETAVRNNVAQYQSALSQTPTHRTIQWNPQRSDEQPSDLGSAGQPARIPHGTAGDANGMVLQPAHSPSGKSNQLAMRETQESSSAPRIHVQTPATQSSSIPIMRAETDTPEAETITNWRFSD